MVRIKIFIRRCNVVQYLTFSNYGFIVSNLASFSMTFRQAYRVDGRFDLRAPARPLIIW